MKALLQKQSSLDLLRILFNFSVSLNIYILRLITIQIESEPNILKLQEPVIIVGDIHG